MTVEAYMNSSYRYLQSLTCLSASDIITAVAAELVAGGWSSLGGGVYKSPVDAASRFFEVTLSAISATNLEMAVTDQNGAAIQTRRAYCSASANTVNIFTGQFHMVVDIIQASTAEFVAAGILDASPHAQGGTMNRYVWAAGSRSAAGSLSSNGANYAAIMDLSTGTLNIRVHLADTKAGGGSVGKALDGSYIYRALDVFARTATVNVAWAGRMYQMASISSSLPVGTSVTLPLDSTTNGVFLPIQGVSSYNAKMWVCRIG